MVVIRGVRVTRSLIVCVMFCNRCLYMCIFVFILDMIMSVLLRLPPSDYPFDIFKLSLTPFMSKTVTAT
jgi:hypothetical protein